MHISKKHVSDKNTKSEDKYKFQPVEEVEDDYDLSQILNYYWKEDSNSEAYGNDAEYWHDEFQKVVNARDVLEQGARKSLNMMRANYQNLLNSRDAWKQKSSQYAHELTELKQKFPQNFSWPKYPDGEFLKIGDKIKVSFPTGEEEMYVSFISFNEDGEYILENEFGTRTHANPEFDYPDPDSEEKILSDAVTHLYKLLDEGEFSNEIVNNEPIMKQIDQSVIYQIVDLYKDRLDKLHNNIINTEDDEDADADETD